MKYNFLAFVLLLSFSLNAQDDVNTTNTDAITPDEIENNKVSVKFDESQDHFMLNLTIDNMIDKGPDTFYNSSGFNPNLGMYFMYDVPFGKSGLGFAPGIGFTFSKVNLDNSILYQDSLGSTFINSKYHPLVSGPEKTYDKSSYYNSWVEIPIELRYRSKPINGTSSIKIAAGFRAGFRLASNSKIRYIDNELQKDIVLKDKVYTDVNPIRYGVTLRMGYGAFNLFGYYGLNEYFKDSKNTNNLQLTQYSIGLSITGM